MGDFSGQQQLICSNLSQINLPHDNEFHLRSTVGDRGRYYTKFHIKMHKWRLTLPWYQSSQITHCIIASSTLSSGSGYGRLQVQYNPLKLSPYKFSAFSESLFCGNEKT